jgi:phosphoribosylanthranilate isomerase
MTPQVKICGLTRDQDVEVAIRYGASFLGFMVEANSPRKLTVLEASLLAAPVMGIIPRVAVTVNADDQLLYALRKYMRPDYIQCHGDESPERVAEIARKYGVKTIKAVPISSGSDMKAAEAYSGVCDFILYDAKPPNNANVRGGHGLVFDWNILKTAPLPKKWALAGGLTPDNVARAVTKTHAPILDVSSGIEAGAGLKDAAKLKAFMDAVTS